MWLWNAIDKNNGTKPNQTNCPFSNCGLLIETLTAGLSHTELTNRMKMNKDEKEKRNKLNQRIYKPKMDRWEGIKKDPPRKSETWLFQNCTLHNK